MPDKPGRSAFIPLLVVGVVVMIGLFLVFVPVLECSCESDFNVWTYRSIHQAMPELGPNCKACGDTGKVPLLNSLTWGGWEEKKKW